MAEALNIYINETTKAKLNEIQAGIIDNIQKTGNSFKFKSTNSNLNDNTVGTYNFKRWENSAVNEYGTARKAQKGDHLTAPNIPVQMNIKREIVEEVEKFDATRYGLDASLISLATRRSANHQASMKREIESAFWECAYLSCLQKDSANMVGSVAKCGVGTNNIDVTLEENLLVPLSKTRNKFVNGIDRDLLGGVLSPEFYSKLKTKLNEMYNAGFNVAQKTLQGINGVAMFEEMYLPCKVGAIVLAKEAIAQPLVISEYQAEKIQLSDAYALALFFYYGIKALAPDTIKVMVETDATHPNVEVVSDLTSTATDTILIVDKDSANYDSTQVISKTNYPIGTMFVYDGTDYIQYNTYDYKPTASTKSAKIQSAESIAKTQAKK